MALWTPVNSESGAKQIAWLDGLDNTKINTASSTVWTPKGSLAISGSQSTASQRPTVSSTGRNGKQALGFSGNAQQFLNLTTANLPTGDCTVFIAAYMNPTGSGATVRAMSFGGSSGNQSIELFRGYADQTCEITCGQSQVDWAGYDRFVMVVKSGTVGKLYVDGVLAATGNFNTLLANSVGYIGRGLNYPDFFDGLIQQVGIGNWAVSESERPYFEGWESWADGKNGSNLQASHPYKSSAPTVAASGSSYALTAAGGAYALTGRATTFARLYRLAGAAGSIALTDRSASQSLRRSATQAAFALTGRAASQALRRVASPSVFAITGRSAAQAQSRSATPASYALTGGQTSTARARTLLAGVGLFASTGGAARQAQGRSASPGAFTVTGQPIAQGHIFTLACGAGSIVVTGQAASRSLIRRNSAATIVVTGFASSKAVGRQAAGGTLTLTGKASSRGLGRFLAPAVFAVTGPSAARALNLAAPSSASSTVTGRPTSDANGRFAAPGTFVLNGVAAGLRSLRSLAAGPGTFGTTGFASGYTNSHVSGYTLGAASGQYTVAMYGNGGSQRLPFMKRKRVRFGLTP